MRPAVTVIPESFSPSRLLLPMGSTLSLERQPVWVRWHALLTAPASNPVTQGPELVRAQRAAEAIFAEKCRALCVAGEASAEFAAHEISRALVAEGLLPKDPEGDFSDGRRLAAVIAVDRGGRWSVARLGRSAISIAVVFQAPQRPAGVLWLDEPSDMVELPGAAEPQAFVAFERRDRTSEEELRSAFEALVDRVRELLVPPGAIGGMRLPIVALGQGLPLLESRLLETNEALAGLMVESQQALVVVNETVRPLVKELRSASEESSGALAAVERARKVLEEASEEARQQRASLIGEVATISERWARATEGLEEHRLRAAQGMDDQLSLVGQSAAQLAETAGRIAELGGSLDGSLLVLRDTAGEVLEALERKSTGIEALLLQTESLEQAVHSTLSSVGSTDAQLREQAKGLVEFRKTVGDFVRRLGEEVAKAEAMSAASSRMEAIAAALEPLRAALAQTMTRVDESAVGLLDSLNAKSKLFDGYLAESKVLSGNLARAVSSVGDTEEALRNRVQALHGTHKDLASATKGLASQIQEAREAAASWKKIVDDAGGGVRAHLQDHERVRGQLGKLDEAAQLGLVSLEETEQRLGNLRAQVDGGAAAVAQIAAGVEPALGRLKESINESVDEAGRFASLTKETTRAAEALGTELKAMRKQSGAWKGLLDDAQGVAKSHLDGYEAVRASLHKLDEASQVGTLEIEELEGSIEALKKKLAGSSTAVDSLTSSIAPSVEKLKKTADEVARFSGVTTETTRAAEALAGELKAMRDQAGSWKALLDETRGSVKTHLDAHQGVQGTLKKLAEASEVGVLGIEELEGSVEALKKKLAGSGTAVDSLASSIAPSVEKLKKTADEVARFSGVTAETTRAAEALAGELKAMRDQAGSWKALLDETRGSVKTHLDAHQGVQGTLKKLAEASEVGVLGIEELEGALEALKKKLAGSGSAIDSLAAGMAPSVARLQEVTEEVARFGRAAGEATRSIEAARTSAPELEKAVASFGAELEKITRRAQGDQAATDESRKRVTRAAEDLELAASELLSGDRGVSALLTNTEKARAQLASATEGISSVIDGLRKREEEIGRLASATTLGESEARISEAAARLEQLFDESDGPVEACRNELAQVTDQLRAAGERVDGTAQEIEDVRGSLAQSVDRLNQRLEELRGFDPQALVSPEQPASARRMPVYAGAVLVTLVASTGLIMYSMPRSVVVEGGAQRAAVASPAPAPTPAAAAAPAPAAPAPTPVAAAAPAPAAPAAPAKSESEPSISAAEKAHIADALKTEIEAGVIAIDERGGNWKLVLPEDALFTPTTAKVVPGGRKVLDALVREVKAMPARGIMVSAFTDRTAKSNAEKDMALTLDRAWHVGDYLGSQGIDKALIGAAGYGELEPVVDNGDDAKRIKNRRVEIAFLPPAATPAPPAAAPAAGAPDKPRSAPAPSPSSATPAPANPAPAPPGSQVKKVQLDPE